MKFLADEDFPKPLTVKIRNLDFSVRTIQQKNLQGSSDETVANIALKEKRIILTFDKDFLKNQPSSLKAVVFEFPKKPTLDIIPLIETFLNKLSRVKFSKLRVLKFNKNGLTEISNL